MIAKITKDNKGMTLLEVLVAAFILALVALPLLSLFSNSAWLVNRAYQSTDDTYNGKSLMERLYASNYSDLFQKGKLDRTLDSATGSYYRLSLSPSGPAGVVGGTACYFHIIVNSSGSGVFTGPDYSGAPTPVSAAALAGFKLKATTEGTDYELMQGGSSIKTGKKPANTTPVLLVLTNSETASLGINIEGDGAVLVYCKPTLDTTKITGSPTPIIYNNDAPPSTLLVNAVLKVYRTDNDADLKGIFQNTLSVGPLP